MLIFSSQLWGCRPFVRKNVEAVCSFFIRFDSNWMVWFAVWRWCWWLLSFDIEMAFWWERVCVYVWLGRSLVGNWMVLSARKTHNWCKLLQNYLSVFLNRPNPCNDKLRLFWFVVAGLKWMASSVFVVLDCFCDGLKIFFLLAWVYLSPLSKFTRRTRKK